MQLGGGGAAALFSQSFSGAPLTARRGLASRAHASSPLAMARRSQRVAGGSSVLPLALLFLLASPAVHQCTAGRVLHASSGLNGATTGSTGSGATPADGSGPPGGSDAAVNATASNATASNQTAPPSPKPLRGAELLKQASVALGLVELANGEPGRAAGGGGATGPLQPNGSKVATGGEQVAQPTAVGATGATGPQQQANSSGTQLAAGNSSAQLAANSSDSMPPAAQQQQQP